MQLPIRRGLTAGPRLPLWFVAAWIGGVLFLLVLAKNFPLIVQVLGNAF